LHSGQLVFIPLCTVIHFRSWLGRDGCPAHATTRESPLEAMGTGLAAVPHMPSNRFAPFALHGWCPRESSHGGDVDGIDTADTDGALVNADAGSDSCSSADVLRVALGNKCCDKRGRIDRMLRRSAHILSCYIFLVECENIKIYKNIKKCSIKPTTSNRIVVGLESQAEWVTVRVLPGGGLCVLQWPSRGTWIVFIGRYRNSYVHKYYINLVPPCSIPL